MFRFIVLGLLRRGRTLHGYALMKAYEKRTGVRMSTGTFYRELQNLVSDGLVRTVEREPEDDARRTPYQVTARGAEMFDRWLIRPPQLAAGTDDELTARTMFLYEAPAETAHQMIESWKEELWLLGKKLERDRQNEIHRCTSDGEPFSILTLLLARRLRHIAGDVAYLDELRTALEERHAADAQASAPAPTVKSAHAVTPRTLDERRPRARAAAGGSRLR